MQCDTMPTGYIYHVVPSVCVVSIRVNVAVVLYPLHQSNHILLMLMITFTLAASLATPGSSKKKNKVIMHDWICMLMFFFVFLPCI